MHRSVAQRAEIVNEPAGLPPRGSDCLNCVDEPVTHLYAVLVDVVQHVAGVDNEL